MDVPEILVRHERTLDALRVRLQEIPEGCWTWRPGAGAWSPAEVYDHIDRIARLYSFAKLEACLAGEGRAGGSPTLTGRCLLAAPSLAGLFRFRREFPEALEARGVTRAEAARALDALRCRARAAARRVAADPGRLRVEHVALGWLTAAQWFAFAELHSRHHLAGQLARLQRAWERQARPSARPAPDADA